MTVSYAYAANTITPSGAGTGYLAEIYAADLNNAWGVVNAFTDVDMVTNGVFAADTDWTKGTGWTIAAGVADCDGSQVADSDLEQDVSLVAGVWYLITYTVGNYAAGNVTVVCGTNEGTDKAANGTYYECLKAAGDSTLRVRGDSNFDGDIDNVSCVRLTGNYQFMAGFTIGNGTDATVIDMLNETLEIADGFALQVEDHSVLNMGQMSGSYGIDGSWISVGDDTHTDIVAAADADAEYNQYAGRLIVRTNQYTRWLDGTVRFGNAELSYSLSSGSNRVFQIGANVKALEIMDLRVLQAYELEIITAIWDYCHRLRFHDVTRGLYVNVSNVVYGNVIFSGTYTYDSYLTSNETNLTIHNPNRPLDSVTISTAGCYQSERYSLNIHTTDADGDDLNGVSVTGTKTYIVQGTDGNPYRCILNHTADNDKKPITGGDYATYWEAITDNVAGGDWVTGTDYTTDAAVFADILTTDSVEVTGNLYADVMGTYINIGPQAANGYYDGADDCYQNQDGPGYIWYVTAQTCWMISLSIGTATASVAYWTTNGQGDETVMLNDYTAGGLATGTAAVADGRDGMMPPQNLVARKFTGTSEDEDKWEFDFTFAHADYPDHTKNNIVPVGPQDWEYALGNAAAAVTAPKITLVELTTTSLRVTIAGDAGATHYARYATGLGGAWTAGGNRSGDGVIDIAGLTAGATYYVQVYAVKTGYNSTSSVVEGLTLSGGDALTTAANLLQESLAASATFRTWTGTADAAAAKERIHLWAVDESGLTRPLGLITPGSDYSAERTAFGTGDWHSQRGELQLTLEKSFDADEPVATNITNFALATGKIVKEVLNVSGRGGYLAIERLERIDGPGLAEEDQKNRIVAETYGVFWN